MNKQTRINRITSLWFIVLTGLMYHTVLHLVPGFYGIDIVKPGATGQMPISMVLTFGLSFLIPVLAIIAVNFLKNNMGWLLNFILSSMAMLINTGHLSEFFTARRFDPTQLFIIIPIFLISILLITDSWKLKKDKL
jgi:hypothetical protein